MFWKIIWNFDFSKFIYLDWWNQTFRILLKYIHTFRLIRSIKWKSTNFSQILLLIKWIWKDSATICNKQNWNRPIRTEDTACQRCVTSLRWANDATCRHQPTAGNNITCISLQLIFECRDISVTLTRNFRRSVTMQTSWEEVVCHK